MMKIPLEGQNALTEKQLKALILAVRRGINTLDEEIGNSMNYYYSPNSAKQALKKLENARDLWISE